MKVGMTEMVVMVATVTKAHIDIKAHLEIKDHLEIKVPRVLPETLVFLVKMVLREKGELQVNRVRLVSLASLVWMV